RPLWGVGPDRTVRVAEAVVARLERHHKVASKGGIIPERVKEVRRAVIKAIEQDGATPESKSKLANDLDDLFFVIQLFSYPGDYVAEQPTIERIAETLDKVEEDVLRAGFPGLWGTR